MNIVRRRCTPSYRFNPHLISEPIGKTKEMILATVMNDVGNGNKDEVKINILMVYVVFSKKSSPLDR